ncbi:hypothetical protein QQS21_003586 [Conoideocrella luteorostrata]|uniref:deuterolysin n=1 Tax=Conoideocrella luteorostrata TaxID=1105319 RepID=A0AAJ0CU21_9HYPO|nr:hypothetical protein QQS21_003586 [Conoideocrella luteorostrata]
MSYAVPGHGFSTDLSYTSQSLGYEKRTELQSTCDSVSEVVKRAISNCAMLAVKAQKASAQGNEDKMDKHFGAHDQKTRDYVSRIFSSITKECSLKPGGSTTIACAPDHGGIFAGTGGNKITLFRPFFSEPDLPKPSDQKGLSTATTIIHEMSHTTVVGQTKDNDSEGKTRNAYNYQEFAADVFVS